MNIDRYKIFHAFKYTIYALLTLNVYFFFAEEWAASSHRFSDGIQFGDIIEGFAATIDTVAWVILLLMFELQTSVLADNAVGTRVSRAMHFMRAICYAFIVYAFYGYLSKLLFLLGAEPLPSIVNLCELTGGNWTYAIDLDEYEIITMANCATLSEANVFQQLSGLNAVVDQSGLTDIVRLAWVDVINSGVWLLVVFLLEFDVRLQEHHQLAGTALRISNWCKYVLYSILLLAAIYWGVKGDFVDFWDAFLWLVAFVFVELNVFEWRQETLEELPQTDRA
ncbi:MAG TPA: hypothetical protein VMO24_09890 [Woeseiaceae bacterium]|nr:hypothetical protein [Woeseiaceae bacterium]